MSPPVEVDKLKSLVLLVITIITKAGFKVLKGHALFYWQTISLWLMSVGWHWLCVVLLRYGPQCPAVLLFFPSHDNCTNLWASGVAVDRWCWSMVNVWYQTYSLPLVPIRGLELMFADFGWCYAFRHVVRGCWSMVSVWCQRRSLAFVAIQLAINVWSWYSLILVNVLHYDI